MKYTVDKIDGDIATLEDDMLLMLSVPVAMLPENVREGSILDFDGSTYILCEDEESERRKKLFALQKKLMNGKKSKKSKKSDKM